MPLVVTYFALPAYHLWIWGTIGMAASIAVLTGAMRNQPRRRLPWVLVAFALAAFAAGDTTYNVLTQYFHEANPFPSLADGFYLITYPLFAAGLLGMIRARRRERDGGPLLDALVVTAGCALLSWMYLIHPYVHAPGMTVVQKGFSIAYPLGDILILAVLARLLVGGGARNASVALLTAGALGLLAADCVYGYIQLNGNWKVGGPTDIGWVVFYCFWGAAALHPAMRGLTEVQPRRDKQLSVFTLAALTGAALVAPVLTVWRSVVNHNSQDVAVTGTTSAIVFLLVLCRLIGLAREAGKARREGALRLIGERLVAATEIAEVFAQAVESAVAMVPGSKACLITEIRDDERIAASDHPEWVGREVETDSLEATVLGIEISPAVHWTVLPIVGRLRRQLVVGVEAQPSGDVLAALKAVCALVALASERVELTQDLHQRRSEQRFRSLIQNASDVILVVHPDGRMTSEAPSLHAVLGYDSEMLNSRRIEDLLHPADAVQSTEIIATLLAGRRSSPIRAQWQVRHADGRWVDMEVIINDLSDDPHLMGISLTMRDISERTTLEAELRHQASHDSLTGLANRVLFRDRVHDALNQRFQLNRTVAVLVIDIDDFKLVNDTFGHAAGDELLVQVGRRLVGCIRADDTAARLGGDEFALCISVDEGAEAQIADLAQRIIDRLAEPCVVADRQYRTGISIGASIARDDRRNSTDMLREADIALYAAKGAGKASFRIFEPGLHHAAHVKKQRQAQLRDAIDQGDMRLLYQPIVRLTDGAIAELEALVRWQHATEGMIPPAEFIPIAEDSGLIIPLGRWVLERACADLRRWQEHAPQVGMSVNVSPRQLQSSDFLDVIDAVFDEQGVDPASLTFEITETALPQDSDEVLQRLLALRARGITIALDDFGTGYSSLSYLHRFPLQVLKIDRSFVAGMESPDGTAILNAIVSMAASLNLELVAEGIEEHSQLLRLQELRCAKGQGYLFSKPAPVKEIDELFDRGARAFAFSPSVGEQSRRAFVPASRGATGRS